MSITDELRKWAEQHKGWHLFDMQLNAIADRIDAEHEAALLNVHTDLMDASGWVRLPKDADGVPIRVGDVMENIVCPSVHREVTGVGAECFYGWDDGNGRYSQFGANCYRHHHAPTVEDVLREFANGIKDQNKDFTELVIAEYAKRLKLAEEEDA